jgi:hypothetical protein
MKISLIRIFDNSRKESVRCNPFQFLHLSFLCILLMKLSGCSLLNPTMPVKVPIDLSRAGIVAEVEFWIPENDVIEPQMNFYFEDKQAEREQLFNLVGREDIPGILIPIKIQIFKQREPGKEDVFYEKVHNSTGDDFNGFSADYFQREFGRIKISKGNYRLRVEILKPVLEFSNTPVEFCISYFRRK